MGGYHSTNVNVFVTGVIRLAHMPKMVAGNVFRNSQPLHRSKEDCVTPVVVQTGHSILAYMCYSIYSIYVL